MDELTDLEKAIRAMELEFNHRLSALMDRHGLDGTLTALVNVGTGLVAKAMVMTPPESREKVLFTIHMLINARTNEGDAAVQSTLLISKAMGSTCRPH